MAHYSTHVSTVKRSHGQNAIASAAYNARDKLELSVFDKQTGISSSILFDYSNKGGLLTVESLHRRMRQNGCMIERNYGINVNKQNINVTL